MQVRVNEQFYEGESLEGFGNLLNAINGLINAEVELASRNGDMILFLKSSTNGLLFYFNNEYDEWVHSIGDESIQGEFHIQPPHYDKPDNYPLAWRIDLENAYKALSYFFVNDGQKPPFIDWQKDLQNKG